ncbi:MAG: pyridoxal phosphate-dependent aminotransferase [Propylenella sp.]
MNRDFLSALRREARETPESGIVEVFNYGRGRKGLIPLWAGEGDLPTPDFIYEASVKSLKAGETFYTWQRGIPELRAALARYHERHFGRAFTPERFFVTGGGMQAIQIAIAAVAGSDDEVIVPTPAWPNFAAAVGIRGATSVSVPLDFDGTRWSLDLDRVSAAIGERTRAIFVNSPSNPTGWTAREEELRALLEIARRRGLWIIADEVYSRFVFDGADRAPSFYDIMDAGDLVILVNTFSKNWAMTGWRIGWLSAPEALGGVMENLIQYSTSGVAAFMQRGAVAALDDGEEFLRQQVERARKGRDIVCGALAGSNRVRFAWPDGAFYLFFTIDGIADTRELALRLVDEANLGIAPGTAFGAGGESFMRVCFARKAEDLSEAVRRLGVWLES